jgi:hypothetical protein
MGAANLPWDIKDRMAENLGHDGLGANGDRQ